MSVSANITVRVCVSAHVSVSVKCNCERRTSLSVDSGVTCMHTHVLIHQVVHRVHARRRAEFEEGGREPGGRRERSGQHRHRRAHELSSGLQRVRVWVRSQGVQMAWL